MGESGGWLDSIPILGDLFGGAANRTHQNQQQQKDYLHQLEFAQHGLQWRAEDAKRAGINPLAALGFQGPSYSTNVGVEGPGDTISRMGQGIHRMLTATKTDKQRENEFTDLKLENARLQNQMLSSQIAKLNSAQVGPPFPTVVDKPHTRTGMDSQAQYRESEGIPDVGWARTKTGVAPVPSKDVKERIEDQFIPEMMWAVRNNIIPSIGGNSGKPPRSMLRDKRNTWDYNVKKQEWQEVPAASKKGLWDRWSDFATSWQD